MQSDKIHLLVTGNQMTAYGSRPAEGGGSYAQGRYIQRERTEEQLNLRTELADWKER